MMAMMAEMGEGPSSRDLSQEGYQKLYGMILNLDKRLSELEELSKSTGYFGNRPYYPNNNNLAMHRNSSFVRASEASPPPSPMMQTQAVSIAVSSPSPAPLTPAPVSPYPSSPSPSPQPPSEVPYAPPTSINENLVGLSLVMKKGDVVYQLCGFCPEFLKEDVESKWKKLTASQLQNCRDKHRFIADSRTEKGHLTHICASCGFYGSSKVFSKNHPVCPNSTSNTKELFNRLLFDTIEVVRIFGEPPPIGSVVKILRVNKDAMEATQHVSEATFGNIFVVVADPARTSSSAKKRDFALEKGLTPVTSNGVSRVILLDQHVYTKSSEKLYSDTRPTESQIAVIQHNGYYTGRLVDKTVSVGDVVQGKTVLGFVGACISDPEEKQEGWVVEAFCIPDIYSSKKNVVFDFRKDIELAFKDRTDGVREELLQRIQAAIDESKARQVEKLEYRLFSIVDAAVEEKERSKKELAELRKEIKKQKKLLEAEPEKDVVQKLEAELQKQKEITQKLENDLAASRNLIYTLESDKIELLKEKEQLQAVQKEFEQLKLTADQHEEETKQLSDQVRAQVKKAQEEVGKLNTIVKLTQAESKSKDCIIAEFFASSAGFVNLTKETKTLFYSLYSSFHRMLDCNFVRQQMIQLQTSRGFTIDNDRTIFICRPTLVAVELYNDSGNLLRMIPTAKMPTTVEINPTNGNLYVCCGNTVNVYNRYGIPQHVIKSKNDQPFRNVTDIAFAPDGTLYICDHDKYRIYQLPAGSTTLSTFYKTASTKKAPTRITMDRFGQLLVSFKNENKVVVLQGQKVVKELLVSTPTKAAVDRCNNIFIGSSNENTIVTIDNDGQFIGEFDPKVEPEFLKFDKDGYLYVGGFDADTIIKY